MKNRLSSLVEATQRNMFYSQTLRGHGAQELRPAFKLKKCGLGTAAETLTEQSPDKARENPLALQKVGSSGPGLLQRTLPVRSPWKRTPVSSLPASGQEASCTLEDKPPAPKHGVETHMP